MRTAAYTADVAMWPSKALVMQAGLFSCIDITDTIVYSVPIQYY